jgi:hypothetical protein
VNLADKTRKPVRREVMAVEMYIVQCDIDKLNICTRYVKICCHCNYMNEIYIMGLTLIIREPC